MARYPEPNPKTPHPPDRLCFPPRPLSPCVVEPAVEPAQRHTGRHRDRLVHRRDRRRGLRVPAETGKGDKRIVGVTSHQGTVGGKLEILRISPEVERAQVAELSARRESRDQATVNRTLADLTAAARTDANLVPPNAGRGQRRGNARRNQRRPPHGLGHLHRTSVLLAPANPPTNWNQDPPGPVTRGIRAPKTSPDQPSNHFEPGTRPTSKFRAQNPRPEISDIS